MTKHDQTTDLNLCTQLIAQARDIEHPMSTASIRLLADQLEAVISSSQAPLREETAWDAWKESYMRALRRMTRFPELAAAEWKDLALVTQTQVEREFEEWWRQGS